MCIMCVFSQITREKPLQWNKKCKEKQTRVGEGEEEEGGEEE